jgi:hypothetical protein
MHASMQAHVEGVNGVTADCQAAAKPRDSCALPGARTSKKLSFGAKAGAATGAESTTHRRSGHGRIYTLLRGEVLAAVARDSMPREAKLRSAWTSNLVTRP